MGRQGFWWHELYFTQLLGPVSCSHIDFCQWSYFDLVPPWAGKNTAYQYHSNAGATEPDWFCAEIHICADFSVVDHCPWRDHGAVAGREVMARLTTRLRGWWGYGIGTTTMFFISVFTTLLAVGVIIGPDPWYAPRYVLPILGMVLGNTLSGISLGLETLISTLKRERVAIEARIALGHKRFEAVEEPVRQALKTGMMPIINAMAASGIVSLPGMMTGQIMAGADPVEATKYQILIMFLIAGATASGTLLAVVASAYRLTDDRARLRLDRLE